MIEPDPDHPEYRRWNLPRRRLIAGSAAVGLAFSARAAPNPVWAPNTFWPHALTMGTGAPDSGFALYGPVWGQDVHNATAIPLSYRVSGGGAANVLLIEQNIAQLGMTTLAVAAGAWVGRAAWTSTLPLRNFRALFPIYRATLQIVAPYSQSIVRPGDLSGAIVGIGPSGSSSAVLVPPLLASLGIAPLGFLYGGYAAQIGSMMAESRMRPSDRKIAACAFMSATPSSAIGAAARHRSFNLIGFTRAEIDMMRRVAPGLEAVVIPKGTLPRQTAAVATIGTEAIAICRRELPDGLVGMVAQAGLANRAALLRALPGMIPPAHDWLRGDRDIAIHPGAAPALRRFNVPVPDRQVRG